MLGMYGVTWFPLKSYIRTKSKWVKKKNPKRRDTNQTKRIKSKKNVSVHPDIELEKTSRRLGLGYKACLHFLPPPHTSCLMSFNAFSSFFHQFLNYWKGASGFLFVVRNKRRNPQVCAVSLSSSQGSCCLHESLVFNIRSISPSSHLHLNTKTRSIPSHMPGPLIRWWPSSPPPGWRRRWSVGRWAAVGSGCARWCIHSGGSE